MKKKRISKVENEILSFWKEFLPYEVIRIKKNLLPVKIELPGIDAGSNELLNFYEKIAPKRINGLIKRASSLKYPIVDLGDLKSQLGDSSSNLSRDEIELVSNLRYEDFPLWSLKFTLDLTVMRSIARGVGKCWEDYQECLEKGGGGRDPECERAFNLCTAEYDTLLVVIAMAAIAKIRYHYPRVRPFPPQPFPYF